jgi:hypothetical protein
MVGRSVALTACSREKRLLDWRWLKWLVDPRTVNQSKSPRRMEWMLWNKRRDGGAGTMATQAVS